MAAQVRFRLGGGSSNTSPAASLSGAMSTVAGGIITSGGANNVWDDVSGAESAAGDTEYRLVYVENYGDQTLQSAVLWIDSASGAADVAEAVALDNSAVGVAAAGTSADESTAPTPLTDTFASPTTKGAGKSIGNIPAGSYKAFWVRRVISAAAAASSSGFSVRVEGDSAA
jgi:hypothetical protein